MSWTTKQIRTKFLDFFASKQHEIEESAPIVIKDDPTLMFTNAGMNQFKPVFVGNSLPKHMRVANAQKCLRVSGKHNDLEEVGRDHYHHTMFEMLGNWSFGDYFKEESIEWAWELLTKEFKLDKSRMYVSIFSGDESLGLNQDEEALEIWSKHIEKNRILGFGRKENFWEMGDTGPCGPCSEIHYDMRPNSEREKIDGSTLVNKDHPEVIEIWNLVFMQYDQKQNGSLERLSNNYIDTGMGLERLSRVLQGVSSNYDIDVFKALITALETISGYKYSGGDSNLDISFRVIADHLRAVSFCIADGQLPSSNGAGYVIRRVLRRAIRYAYSELRIEQPTLYSLVEVLKNEMGDAYPELKTNAELISRVIKEEERAFQSTLSKGLDRLDNFIKESKSSVISGEFAFELYDTYGFPIDLTLLLAREHDFDVDMNGFQEFLGKQKKRSRDASKVEFGDWVIVSEGENSDFIGYDTLKVESELRKYRGVKVKGKEMLQLVFSQTPFYPEGGGQVGDHGKVYLEGKPLDVVDTKKENGEILHYVSNQLSIDGMHAVLEVDQSWRERAKKNHTATHLLHLALRDHLGTHVEQKGSLVKPDKLRFDFSHFEKVSEADLEKIESQVIHDIQRSIDLEEMRSIPIEEAKAMGAMALFGEKYGDTVRAIKFDRSIELCGGTHVKNTELLDGFKLLSESGVASGVRRIEAITGKAYQDYINTRLDALDYVENKLGNPKNIKDAVDKLTSDYEKLEEQVAEFEKREAAMIKEKLIASERAMGSLKLIQGDLGECNTASLKRIAHELTIERDQTVVVIGGVRDGKPSVVVAFNKGLIDELKADANSAIKEAAKEINGGGGGQPFLAMAGGTNKKGLQRALDVACAKLFD
ncbi:MAG: alanine--tRNA ligase [Salibacteraceae bacterium]